MSLVDFGSIQAEAEAHEIALRSWEELNKSKNQRALDLADEALAIFSKNSLALLVRGRARTRLNIEGSSADFQASIQSASAQLNEQPQDAFLLFVRADAYRMRGRYPEAIRDSTISIQLDPEFYLAYGVRAECYRMLDELQNSIQDCLKCLEINSNYVFAHGTLAETYRQGRQFSLAVEQATKAIELDPEKPFAYSTRADCYRMLGRHEEAIQDATMALSFDGSCYLNPLRTRAKSYCQVKRYDESIADCTAVLRVLPSDTFCLLCRAEAEREKGLIEESVADAVAFAGNENTINLNDYSRPIVL